VLLICVTDMLGELVDAAMSLS